MAKNGALVSVIVPVWNTGRNVEKLIKRLLEQTYKNLEVIAVDDNSNDDSLRVLRGIAKSDVRLKVIHREENGGASAARNTGIEVARGEYVIFVDSDDDVADDFVERLVIGIESKESGDVALAVTGIHFNKLQAGESVDAYVKAMRKRRQGEQRADYLIELLVRDGRMYSSVNKIFRLKSIKNAGVRFEEGRKFAEDTKFVLDYLEYTPGEIVFVPGALYIYNFGTETSTVKLSSTVWGNWKRSYDDLKKWAAEVSGGRIGVKTRALLGLVWLRWRVSWWKARRRGRKG